MDVEHQDLTEIEQQQIDFMAKRLGFDHYLIAGYEAGDFVKHIRSNGLHDLTTMKICANGSLAGFAYIIAQILVDFEFSDELRQGVFSILNTIFTGRKIKEKIEIRST